MVLCLVLGLGFGTCTIARGHHVQLRALCATKGVDTLQPAPRIGRRPGQAGRAGSVRREGELLLLLQLPGGTEWKRWSRVLLKAVWE